MNVMYMCVSHGWGFVLRKKSMVRNTKSSGPLDVTLPFVVRGVRVICHHDGERERGGGDGMAGGSCLVYFR